jgi:two-component system response regulator MprA
MVMATALPAKRKILVVDDDEAVRTGLRGVLMTQGYEVDLANNGREAVERFATSQADLILVDINMPVQNGWGAVAALRSINPRIPVILITARPDQQTIALNAGLELMEKPLDLHRLLHRINELSREYLRPSDGPASEESPVTL